ncbi:hypothetical protein BELL_1129g00030 [Botrytis elliptica]|uniref:Uncharacterized protein n=1 Tax=Botrytis elliptica TaxID=278938 RepID=A0A4Z1IL82_9HELO|nr:hypothetical protein BELL_1129g00030 [Botrytis elliptica]
MSLSAVIINWTATEISLGAVSLIKSFIQITLSDDKPEEMQEVPSNWPSKGEIVLSEVTASYALDQSLALQENLTITAGGKMEFAALLILENHPS